MIQDLLGPSLKEPPIRSGVVQILSGELRRAYDDRPRCALIFFQIMSVYSINFRVHAPEISERDVLARMSVLVFAKRNQSLTPIKIAIRQDTVSHVRPDDGVHVREIAGHIAE